MAQIAVLEASDMEKRQEEIDRLLQLPQESDVWQFGVNQWHDWVYLAPWRGIRG